MVELLRRNVQAGSCFVDVGAHLGYFTCIAAQRGAKVFAFEMHEQFVQLLRTNVALNKLADVQIVQSAVGDGPGQVRYAPTMMPHLVPRSTATDQTLAVAESIGLDDYFQAAQVEPDVLKIDVEGAEAKVLAGMAKLIERRAPTILVELHPRRLPGFGASVQSVLDLLQDHGYQVTAIQDLRGSDANVELVKVRPDTKVNTMVYAVAADGAGRRTKAKT